MRLLALTFLALVALTARVAAPAQSYPLWDRQETVAEYAKRADLPPTRTLDLPMAKAIESYKR